MDVVALKSEIDTNPVSMPYPAFTPANDAAIADVINNADGTNPRTVSNTTVDTGELRGATPFAAYDGLNAAEQSWYGWLSQNGVIPVNSDTLQQLAGVGGTSIWKASDRPTMEPRMLALMQRNGSRAEELGFTRVTPSDVANARNA